MFTISGNGHTPRKTTDNAKEKKRKETKHVFPAPRSQQFPRKEKKIITR